VGTGAVEEEGSLAETLGARSRILREEEGCWGISLFCDALGLVMDCRHLPGEGPFETECLLLAHSGRDPLSAAVARPCLELQGRGCGAGT